MVLKLEEADLYRGAPQLFNDLGAALLEVAEVDAANLAVGGLGADRAHARFQLQFVEGVSGAVLIHVVLLWPARPYGDGCTSALAESMAGRHRIAS
ncbi:hypothetical protein SDC9_202311 [bioreactor metagenome]|uniref:Uncharacterized protein n=1 Tax=bioreactor metagenome TaxID=1076179 RepID=A0A645IW36_9ZZZZ